MIVSTQCEVLADRIGYKNAIELLANVGYDAIDLSLFRTSKIDGFPFGSSDKEYVSELVRVAKANGVYFNQAHAPFPSIEKNVPNIIHAIELAAVAGARQIVVHPVCGFDETAACIEHNIKFYNGLIPYVKGTDMKIAVENMWGYDDKRGHIVPNHISLSHEIAECFDALDPEYFTVCLDIGHCALVGEEPALAIKRLGSRIGALHVHDVDYKNDLHTLPGYGMLDWDEICTALADIRYSGDFTFEADMFFSRVATPLLPDAAAYMCKVGKHLASNILSLTR